MRKLWVQRKAVSSMIGGIIVLSLFLTALTAMVLVSQQNDIYQSIANKMSQKDIDRFTENVIANYPGLTRTSDIGVPVPAMGVPCTGPATGKCNQYDMSVSNVGGLSNAGNVGGSLGGSAGAGGGGVGIQILRIYVNSTASSTGCALPNPPSPAPGGPCIISPDPAWLNPTPPTPKANTFRASDAFVNPGEYNHLVRFWLPCVTSCSGGIWLPGEGTTSPQNSVWIITARGRTFSFQWPFPPAGQAQFSITANIFTGVMKIAWVNGQWWDGGSSYSTGAPNSQTDTCHLEGREPLPSGGNGVSSPSSLSFVKPWITHTLLQGSMAKGGGPGTGSYTMYVYAKFTNPFTQSIQVSNGNLIMLVALSGSNDKPFFIGGTFLGVVYPVPSTFTPVGTSVTIAAGGQAILLYQINAGVVKSSNGDTSNLQFSGQASVTNALRTDQYFAAAILLDGLFDVGSPSC